MGRVPPPAGGWRGALGRLREAAWPAGLPSGAGSAAGVAETGAAARGGERSLKERSALFGEALARYRGSWSTVEAAPGGRARGRGAAGAVGEPGAAGGGGGEGGSLGDELGEAARALARGGARGLGPVLRKASRERLGAFTAGLREFVAGYREGLAEGPRTPSEPPVGDIGEAARGGRSPEHVPGTPGRGGSTREQTKGV